MSARVMFLAVMFLTAAVGRADPPETYTPAPENLAARPWFQGCWYQKETSLLNRSPLTETYRLIHGLQPAALIGNNHHQPPFAGEDFQMFERDLPGENSMGFNSTTVGNLPLEMAQTMNGSWGFNLIDDQFKSAQVLVRNLVSAAGRNANFLLNTGPLPNGELQPENVKTFAQM